MFAEAGPSLKLYRAFGITVRLHWSFALLPIIVLLETAPTGHLQWGLLMILAIYVIILLHEYGHATTARKIGVGADEIVLGMLGGVSMCGEGRSAFEDILVAFAGPLVNIFIGGFLLLPLALQDIPLGWELFHPLAGYGNNLWVWLFKANLILLLFNLLPIYPLDGGRIFTGLLAMRMGKRRALLISTPIAIPLAIVMIGLAIVTEALVWAIISIVILWVAYRVYRLAKAGLVPEYPGTYAGSSWSAGFEWSPPPEPKPKRPGLFTRWKMKRRAKKRAREEESERRLKDEVDRILEKVGREGMASLTPSERRILEDASRRMRGN